MPSRPPTRSLIPPARLERAKQILDMIAGRAQSGDKLSEEEARQLFDKVQVRMAVLGLFFLRDMIACTCVGLSSEVVFEGQDFRPDVFGQARHEVWFCLLASDLVLPSSLYLCLLCHLSIDSVCSMPNSAKPCWWLHYCSVPYSFILRVSAWVFKSIKAQLPCWDTHPPTHPSAHSRRRR